MMSNTGIKAVEDADWFFEETESESEAQTIEEIMKRMRFDDESE